MLDLPQQQLVRQLQARLDQVEDSSRAEAQRGVRREEAGDDPPWRSEPGSSGPPTAARPWDVVSSGVAAIDRQLPQRGFRRGTLVEWLAARGMHRSGAGGLALLAAREAARDGGAIVLFDGRYRFYPPAAVRLGLDPARLILVRPRNADDEPWALQQACRTHGVAAVVWWGDAIEANHFRRLQLACESSLALGILVRPGRLQAEPSWAESRWLVEPVAANTDSELRTAGSVVSPPKSETRNSTFSHRRLRLHLLRCRGSSRNASIDLEFHESTGGYHAAPSEPAHPLRVAAPMADRPLARRA